MSKRFTTLTHSWSGGGGGFCVSDASACWGGSHPWPNGSPPPIFSWPTQMKISNLKCLSKWFWWNAGERAWGGFHCVGGRGDDGGEAGEQQDGHQPRVNKFNCDQLDSPPVQCARANPLKSCEQLSPDRYIDMKYRLSIYRHFWKISISISISIWRSWKYRYRYR